MCCAVDEETANTMAEAAALERIMVYGNLFLRKALEFVVTYSSCVAADPQLRENIIILLQQLKDSLISSSKLSELSKDDLKLMHQLDQPLLKLVVERYRS